MVTKTYSPGLSPDSCTVVLIVFTLLVLAACAGAGCVSQQSPAPVPAVTTLPAASPGPTPVPTASLTSLPATPLQRIIVTNADAAELLLAIGVQDQVVGISDTVKTHPLLGPRFFGVKSIGSWQTPDVETILSLHPDAVISYSSYTPKNIDKITSAGIPLLLIDCYKIDTLASDTRKLGNLTGREKGAALYIAFLEQNEALVQSRIANLTSVDTPRVYFESYSDYSALTAGSGGDLLTTMAGGSNIAGMLPASSPKVNAEWVYAENPAVIVKVAASGKNESELRNIRDTIAGRTGIANTAAVRNGQVYVMSNSVTYGPRSAVGLVYIAKILHPAEFEDIHPSAILDDYAGRFVQGANVTPVFSPPLK